MSRCFHNFTWLLVLNTVSRVSEILQRDVSFSCHVLADLSCDFLTWFASFCGALVARELVTKQDERQRQRKRQTATATTTTKTKTITVVAAHARKCDDNNM